MRVNVCELRFFWKTWRETLLWMDWMWKHWISGSSSSEQKCFESIESPVCSTQLKDNFLVLNETLLRIYLSSLVVLETIHGRMILFCFDSRFPLLRARG